MKNICTLLGPVSDRALAWSRDRERLGRRPARARSRDWEGLGRRPARATT